MAQGWVQIAVFLIVLTALVPFLGGYMARVFQGERVFLSPVFEPIERFSYRVLRVRPGDGQDWKAYARSVIVLSLLSWLRLSSGRRHRGSASTPASSAAAPTAMRSPACSRGRPSIASSSR
jgi:K+-transporting ATPase ATPase A chain